MRLANLNFTNTFLDDENLPESSLQDLKRGELAAYDEGVLTRTPAGNCGRKKWWRIGTADRTIRIAAHSPDRLYGPAHRRDVLRAVRGRPFAAACHRSRENLLTGENDRRNDRNRVAAGRPPAKARPTICYFPIWAIMCTWPGAMARCWTSTRATSTIRNWSRSRPGARSRAIADRARVSCWARRRCWPAIRPDKCRPGFASSRRATTTNRPGWCAAHTLPGAGQPVSLPGRFGKFAAVGRRLCRSIGAGVLSDQSAAGFARRCARPAVRSSNWRWRSGDDGMLGLAGRELIHWQIDPRYPETNFRSLFLPIWYEDNRAPAFVWQSGSGLGRRRAEVEPDSADLRHAQGDVLFDAVRRAAGVCARHLHQRVHAARG